MLLVLCIFQTQFSHSPVNPFKNGFGSLISTPLTPRSSELHNQRCQPHTLTKLTIFKIWQEDFEVGRKILRKCIKRIKLATKNHDPSPRVSFFLTAQLCHYSPVWKLFNLLTAPVYCGCCAWIGSLLTWPWLALKIDTAASLDSGPLSFSLCTVLNEKGDRGTV